MENENPPLRPLGRAPTFGRSMASTEKISVTIPTDELEWARKRAEAEGASLSSIVSDALRERRRLEAMREVSAWLSEGQPEVTPAEIDAVRREWAGE